jgi:hypothetical protein
VRTEPWDRSRRDQQRQRERREPDAGRRGLLLSGKFVVTSPTIEGMMSAAPIPSSNDHPMSSTTRFGAIDVVNEPAPCTTQPVEKGAPASEDRRDLAACDHECRHDEPVQGCR